MKKHATTVAQDFDTITSDGAMRFVRWMVGTAAWSPRIEKEMRLFRETQAKRVKESGPSGVFRDLDTKGEQSVSA